MFGDKLKSLRLGAGLTQEEAAGKLDVSLRTYQNYEWGRKYPKQPEVYDRIGGLFGVDKDSLLDDDDWYIMNAYSKGGTRSRKDVQGLVTDIGGLFAGGELTDADKDKVLRVIIDLYWKGKEKNRKFATAKKAGK